jgi:hypothetical protein
MKAHTLRFVLIGLGVGAIGILYLPRTTAEFPPQGQQTTLLASTVPGSSSMSQPTPTTKPAALDAIKQRFYSTDQDTSALALGELIAHGKQATSILIEALHAPNDRTRRLAAEGLSDIGDATAAEPLFAATHDSSGPVRARAATALARLGDPRARAALVATLDDYPDELHGPYTASMYPLMRDTAAVLPLIVPLLKAPDQITRQRALLIIKAVVAKLPAGTNWEQLSTQLGSYDPAGPANERNAAADQWQAWVQALKP